MFYVWFNNNKRIKSCLKNVHLIDLLFHKVDRIGWHYPEPEQKYSELIIGREIHFCIVCLQILQITICLCCCWWHNCIIFYYQTTILNGTLVPPSLCFFFYIHCGRMNKVQEQNTEGMVFLCLVKLHSSTVEVASVRIV